MYLDERSDHFWALTNPGGNYSAAGLPSRVPTLTRPDLFSGGGLAAPGDGVIAAGGRPQDGGAFGPRQVVLVPFGTGAAGNTFSMNVLGWRATPGNLTAAPPSQQLWVPVLLASYAVTLGTAAGLAGADLGAAVLFAASFVATSPGNAGEGWLAFSPGGAGVGMAVARCLGFRYLEVVFATGGSAAGCNALYCKM